MAAVVDEFPPHCERHPAATRSPPAEGPHAHDADCDGAVRGDYEAPDAHAEREESRADEAERQRLERVDDAAPYEREASSQERVRDDRRGVKEENARKRSGDESDVAIVEIEADERRHGQCEQ